MSQKAHILIVDDSPEDIHLLISGLNESYTLKAATSADDALQTLGEPPLPNLILLDVNMPGTNGYEACKHIKADTNLKDIDIIFLSANDSNEEIIQGLDAGALDYIVKPYDLDLLQSKIKNAINSHDKRIALKTQAEQASQLVHTVMSESGNLGNIISFLRGSFTSKNVIDLLHELVNALRQYGLNAVVSFYADNIREMESTSGEISMLEIELLERMHGFDKPFVEHDSRMFIIQKNTVIFIKNVPEDSDKRGSLKDNLMILIEGANARLEHFIRLAEDSDKRTKKVAEVILRAKNTLDEIHQQQDEHKKKGMTILDTMVSNVESHFFSMGLTDEQEQQLLNILSESVDQSLAHMEKGLKIDARIKQTVAELSSVASDTVSN